MRSVVMSLFKYNFINETVKLQSALFIFKRFKSKKTSLEKNKPTNRALNHFDDFYKSVFGDKWSSVRLGLLSRQRYIAVINNFGEVEKTEEFFQNQGAFELRSFLEVQKNFVKNNENSKKQNKREGLEDVITQKLYIEEEKESQLHPEGMEFKLKGDHFKLQNEESESKDEHYYKPEDARTSLNFDLNKAEIDMTRLITPDSKLLEGNLMEFIPATKLRGAEEFIAESDYYKYYQPKSPIEITVEEEYILDFPENLKVYSFDRGDISDFPDPHRNVIKVYDYLKVDGSDLLAALALDVQPNDAVLDMCSSSGNIAYCIYQTLRPKFLVCTKDKNNSVKHLFNNYLLDYSQLDKNPLYVTPNSVEDLGIDYSFDKILVNVPSTEDRFSLFETEDNIFHVVNTRYRLTLPELQCELLVKGLKLARPGGTILYTSSTLSPVQNDGVVNQALRIMLQESEDEFVVRDLKPALRHTSMFFNYGDYLNLKFGTLVVPFVPVNFGPRYICKIMKKGKANIAETEHYETVSTDSNP